jgi:hypothetical protein
MTLEQVLKRKGGYVPPNYVPSRAVPKVKLPVEANLNYDTVSI